MTNVQSEGEIDTWNEITLDKLKSNLSDVGLPSDSELIRVSYVMNSDCAASLTRAVAAQMLLGAYELLQKL